MVIISSEIYFRGKKQDLFLLKIRLAIWVEFMSTKFIFTRLIVFFKIVL
jgi:hypothetical protein